MKSIQSVAFQWVTRSLILLFAGTIGAGAQSITVVNMVPQSLSNETVRDAEPNISVNPASPQQIAASAFTTDPAASGNSPIYVSTDGGQTWNLNVVFPGAGCGSTATCDATLRFADTSNVLYAGILRGDNQDLNILRSGNFLAPGLMTTLVDRTNEDQPWVEAATAGTDRGYVGNNDFSLGADSASVILSADAATAPPPAGFAPHGIDTRATCHQDGPSIRPAVHSSGVIYAVYFGWRGTCSTTDVVVARDDNWGSGATPFTSLLDTDTNPGVRVVSGVSIPPLNATLLGTQRVGSQLAIAVDPTDSQTVYVAWADSTTGPNYTVHVRRSKLGGAAGSWSADLQTIVSATNPGLAVNAQGKVGFLFQKLVNPGSGDHWETHLVISKDGSFSSPSDLVLARLPDQNGGYGGVNPIGDYDNVIAVGSDFYGIFSGNNTPDLANFPNGVTYQRFADFTSHTLFADAGHTTSTPVSIDPFFFHFTPPPALQYAAKFVCGRTNEEEAEHGQGMAADATYFTLINLHNPGDKTAPARMKIATTKPNGVPGNISPFLPLSLNSDQAMEVDCAQIRKLANDNSRFLEGFVIVESDFNLDDVAVYTAGHEGKLQTFDTERVPERKQ